jgi:hypothetical protein
MIQTCWPVRLSEISLRQVIQQSLKRSTVTRSMITEGRTRPVLQHHNHEAHHTRACIHTQHGIAAISGAKTNTVHRFPNISHGRSDTQQGPSHIQDLCIDGRVLIASTGQQLDLRWVPGWRVGAPIVCWATAAHWHRGRSQDHVTLRDTQSPGVDRRCTLYQDASGNTAFRSASVCSTLSPHDKPQRARRWTCVHRNAGTLHACHSQKSLRNTVPGSPNVIHLTRQR